MPKALVLQTIVVLLIYLLFPLLMLVLGLTILFAKEVLTHFQVQVLQILKQIRRHPTQIIKIYCGQLPEQVHLVVQIV